MINLFKINRVLVTITVLLCFTLWGGIIALPILGLSQIIMSCIIAMHMKRINKTTKLLFITYITSTISLILFFKTISKASLEILFLWILISIILACFHLYITYKIKKYSN